MSSKHERNCFTPKQPTKCWECEWAAGKNGKCPWATKFEPVPGWEAIPTKLLVSGRQKIDSFIVVECPEFELMREIKLGIIESAGKTREAKYTDNKYNKMYRQKYLERKKEKCKEDTTL